MWAAASRGVRLGARGGHVVAPSEGRRQRHVPPRETGVGLHGSRSSPPGAPRRFGFVSSFGQVPFGHARFLRRGSLRGAGRRPSTRWFATATASPAPESASLCPEETASAVLALLLRRGRACASVRASVCPCVRLASGPRAGAADAAVPGRCAVVEGVRTDESPSSGRKATRSVLRGTGFRETLLGRRGQWVGRLPWARVTVSGSWDPTPASSSPSACSSSL